MRSFHAIDISEPLQWHHLQIIPNTSIRGAKVIRWRNTIIATWIWTVRYRIKYTNASHCPTTTGRYTNKMSKHGKLDALRRTEHCVTHNVIQHRRRMAPANGSTMCKNMKIWANIVQVEYNISPAPMIMAIERIVSKVIAKNRNSPDWRHSNRHRCVCPIKNHRYKKSINCCATNSIVWMLDCAKSAHCLYKKSSKMVLVNPMHVHRANFMCRHHPKWVAFTTMTATDRPRCHST